MGDSMASHDEHVRNLAADAPLYVKRNMDRVRESRGLPLLWGPAYFARAAAMTLTKPAARSPSRAAPPRAESVARAATTATAPAVRPAPRQTAPAPATRAVSPAPRAASQPTAKTTKRPATPAPDGAYYFAGVVAPGTSEAIPVGKDRVVSRERIEAGAFAGSIGEINAGRLEVALLDDHDGPALASTRDGTLSVEVKPMVGLVVTARVACAYRAAILDDVLAGRAGLSCAFTPRRTSFTKDAQGRSVRIVHEATLDHVALIRPQHGRPAYSTKVVCVDAHARNAERVARSRAIMNGMAIQLREVVAGN